MRKLIAVVGVVSVAFAATTAVGGLNRSMYRGDFEETGRMSFTLERFQNGKRVINFSWKQFPLDCQGRARTSSGHLEFSQKVERRRFSAEAVDDADDPGSRLSMAGRLVGQRNAQGTLRIRGKEVPLDNGSVRNCESGTVGWTAERL